MSDKIRAAEAALKEAQRALAEAQIEESGMKIDVNDPLVALAIWYDADTFVGDTFPDADLDVTEKIYDLIDKALYAQAENVLLTFLSVTPDIEALRTVALKMRDIIADNVA
jgi:hypothetical protein